MVRVHWLSEQQAPKQASGVQLSTGVPPPRKHALPTAAVHDPSAKQQPAPLAWVFEATRMIAEKGKENAQGKPHADVKLMNPPSRSSPYRIRW
jgi:hypothetical protein